MRLGRHGTAALAAVSALALVAAAAPGTTPRGTATTSLSAVEIEITSPLGSGALGILDAATFASTDTDPDVNPEGGPFASASMMPLTGPDGPLGEAEARSNGDTRATWPGGALAGVGGPIAGLGATVSPLTAEATADAVSATGWMETLAAEVVGLAGSLGLTVNASGISSSVDDDGASAFQGLEVSGIDVALGDILPADVLAQLPLGDLLALIDALPVTLPPDVATTVDELRGAIDALVTQLGLVTDASTALDAPLSQLADIQNATALVTQLQGLLTGLRGAGGTTGGLGGALQDVADGLAPITGPLDVLIGGAGAVVPGGLLSASSAHGAASDCIPDLSDPAADLALLGDAADACLLALISETVAAVTTLDVAAVDPTTALADLQAAADALIVTVTTLVDQLVTEITALVPVTAAVDTAALDLGALLASLPGVIDGIAGTPILSVGTITLGVQATSDGSEDGSHATVLCDPVDVTILVETVTSPSCSDGLAAVTDVSALVESTIGTVADVLNSLPLAEVVSAGDLEVGLFTDLREDVVVDGDYVTATAGITALDLHVPSITVDPAPVTGLLDGLGLPDVLGTVEALLADALARVDGLAGLGLGTVSTTLTTAQSQLGAADGLAAIVAQIEALVAGLDIGTLGTLESISTPSIDLRIDPVSTASFAPGASTPVTAPPPAAPSLPSTGGGAALLGLLTMAGAAGLVRKR